jgi:hypothetical protein
MLRQQERAIRGYSRNRNLNQMVVGSTGEQQRPEGNHAAAQNAAADGLCQYRRDFKRRELLT